MMQLTGENSVRKITDYRLMLNAVEKRLLEGTVTEEDRRLLATPEIRRNMNPEQKLHWANLAQMAGELDTALLILASVNRVSSDYAPAWQARLELLQVLGRREEAAVLMAQARQCLGKEAYNGLRTLLPEGPAKTDEDPVPASASEPFERLHRHRSRIERYLRLFSGREDCFARQWFNREEHKQGYVPVHRPMTFTDVEEHLRGIKTYGIYLLKTDSRVSVGAIDADVTTAFRVSKLSADQRRQIHREKNYLITQLKSISQRAGASPLVEFSGGKGFHFWYFFDPPVSAEEARSFLNIIRDALAGDLSVFSLEVFPKQDSLQGKGLGNLIKLPLGVHRLTGKASCFPECPDRSIGAQLDFLSGVAPVTLSQMRQLQAGGPKKEALVIHPRRQEWADQFPELSALETKCPPMGQIIALCRGGKMPAQREERVLYQTIGFLPRAKRLLHYLLGLCNDYNPYLVDYKLSRLRGTPLGCRRIHSLLSFPGDYCAFAGESHYHHPLLHTGGWQQPMDIGKSEKVENLTGAMENLRTAMEQVLRFMK